MCAGPAVSGSPFFAVQPQTGILQAQNTPPSAPTSLSASVGDGAVSLSWNDPGDSTITQYDYRVSADSGSTWSPDWTKIDPSGAATINYPVGSLTNGTTYQFEIRAVNSVGNGAAASVTATAALNLSGWTFEEYPLANNYQASNWSVATDGGSVKQTTNRGPSVYYSDFDAYGKKFTVTVNSGDQNDNDFMGVVLGFQPGDADGTNSDADFLLLTWTLENQNVDFNPNSPSPGGYSMPSIAVSRVTGNPDYDELWQLKNLNGTVEGSAVQELERGSTKGSTGYTKNQDYEFTIDFGRYGLKVGVDGTEEIDIDGDFRDGRFGFYAFSQHNATFKNAYYVAGSFPYAQTVTFDQTEYTAWEGSPASVTVRVDADLNADLNVPITFTDDADHPPESGDYTNPLTNSPLTIIADTGDDNWDSASFTISTTSDTDTDDEKLTLSFGALATDIKKGPSATVTIAEKGTPGQPAAPTLTATSDSFDLSWDAPNGAYASLTAYNLQYQVSGASGWTDSGYTGTATETTISGLSAGTEYDVSGAGVQRDRLRRRNGPARPRLSSATRTWATVTLGTTSRDWNAGLRLSRGQP